MTAATGTARGEGGPDPLAPPYDVRAAVDAGRRRGARPAAACARRCATCCGAGPDGRRGPGRPAGPGPAACAARRCAAATSTARSPGPSSCSTRRSPPSGTSWPAATTTTPGSPSPCWTTCPARPPGRSRSWPTTSGPATRPARSYQQILDGLRQEVVEQRFRGLRAGALADPAAAAGGRRDAARPQRLLDRHARGEDTADAFAEFMRRHGDFFPEKPRSSTS